MKPSVIMLIVVFGMGSLSAMLFFTYQKTSVFPEKTKKELTEMSDRMNNWNETLGKYPTTLQELIGNSPVRQDWKKDAWNRVYKFEITNNGKGFLIISAGADGKFETKDDITTP